jgi:hypothetical protein
MLTGLVGLAVAAFFTGAAVYVLFVEQPARLSLDDRALLAEWQPSYKRGTLMQASLAVVAGVLGLAAWWQTGGWQFFAAATLVLLPWPWTLLVMMPTNHMLERTRPEDATAASRAAVVKWGNLHITRTLLGGLATLAFLWGCSSSV